jgi:hypothetical protein
MSKREHYPMYPFEVWWDVVARQAYSKDLLTGTFTKHIDMDAAYVHVAVELSKLLEMSALLGKATPRPMFGSWVFSNWQIALTEKFLYKAISPTGITKEFTSREEALIWVIEGQNAELYVKGREWEEHRAKCPLLEEEYLRRRLAELEARKVENEQS